MALPDSDHAAYMQALYGKNAIHVPINMIMQPGGRPSDGHPSVAGVFQSTGPATLPMLFGSEHAHQLVLGDVIIRPRLVVGSNHLIGMGMAGLAGLARSGWNVEEWVRRGDVIVGP